MAKTLVNIANDMLRELEFAPLKEDTLVEHGEKVLSLWANGKILEKDGRLRSDDDFARHELERSLIQTASFNKHELPSVYTVMENGRVEMDLPLHAPSWAKAQQLGDAKNYERYSRVARRLQKRLMAKGVKQEELNDLKRFV